MYCYSKEDSFIIKKYKIAEKCRGSNKRFEDKILRIDVLNLLKRCGFKCIYCFEVLSASTWQLDHFHSRATGGKNVISNLAPSCKWCNQMKNALDGNAFLIRIKKILFANLDTELPDPVFSERYVLLRDYPINTTASSGKYNFKNNPNFHIITNRSISFQEGGQNG